MKEKHNPVHSPSHYTQHPAGIECIDVIQHMPYNRACAIKYIWRCEDKGKPIEDLEKAKKMIDFEINRLQSQK